jgi:wyosine [tRNA(Phe)-imidazoG37] synthetase (radical SAM superfamily)
MHEMIYQIIVQGCLDLSWSDWFEGMEIANETGKDAQLITTLNGNIEDQSTLRGILNWLWDLNLTILSVKRVES